MGKGYTETSEPSPQKSHATYNFEHQRKTLIEYLKVKMDEGDWHGVSDAANDLREIEAAHRAGKSPYLVLEAGLVAEQVETPNGLAINVRRK